MKPKHGGAGRGQGRKPDHAVAKTQISITVQPGTLQAARAIMAKTSMSRSEAFDFMAAALYPQFFEE